MPQPAHDARVRDAVRQQPGKMAVQLARELGVPEVEIARAMPSDRVRELDPARWEELIRSFEAAGRVRVLVTNQSTTIETFGEFGGFSTYGDYFNVQTRTLDLHIRGAELTAVFAIEKPGHMNGEMTHSFQFFDRSGAAAFKVFLSFGEPIGPERYRLFQELRERFSATHLEAVD